MAVDALNLSIKEGEIFGLLGPNGAGKTTTVLMLLGLTEPTSGTCRVLGFNPLREPLKIKSLSGYLAERMGVYEDLTPEQNLKYILRLNRIPDNEFRKRIDEALTSIGASGYRNVKVKNLSRGMRQRVAIAGVMVKKPKIAFLDEPTLGLDPKGKTELLDMFKRISRESGVTILLLTHELHDVERICDRVGIMIGGKMVALGSIGELRSKKGEEWVIEVEAEVFTDKLLQEVSGLEGTKNVTRVGNVLTVECVRDMRSEILRVFVRNETFPSGLKAKEHSLDEIYIRSLKEA